MSATTRTGFAFPQVVGHGDGTNDALFVLLATSGGKGVLIAVAESSGATFGAPVELERGETPAQLGIHGVRFSDFLGASGLHDVIVAHHPFMLETTSIFDTHHVLRRDSTLARVCDFNGDAGSSYSKGMGSSGSTRHVSVQKVADQPTLVFQLIVVEETIQRRGRDTTAVITAHQESTLRYEVPSSGACKPLTAMR